MRMSGAALYGLLPAIYRVRDAEEGYPLRELLAVIAEQAAELLTLHPGPLALLKEMP